MGKLIHTRTKVYNIGYHIVWSTKYRRKVLIGNIEKKLKLLLKEISLEKNFLLKELEIMPDHVHIFISAPPKIAPTYIYKMLKGISARRLFISFPDLKEKLWKGHLWNPLTYIETVGHISEASIKKYIQEQKIK